MGWQDILKWRPAPKGSGIEGEQILLSFREFTPIREITKEEEEKILSYSYNPKYGRTLEFMNPFFDEIKRDGLDFVLDFDIDGVPFTLKLPFLGKGLGKTTGIGERAGHIFPEMVSTKTKMCVKAMNTMTKGDMIVTILLASKNNQLPTILTLPAYVEKTFPEINMHKNPPSNNTLFDTMELTYKLGLIYKIYRLVEGRKLNNIADEMRPMDLLHVNPNDPESLNKINELLEQYIPEGLLGRW